MTASATPATVTPSKILLVDDRPENLMALEEVLRPLGQELVSVRSGHDALLALLDEQFAVMLLDVRMPEMDGFEVAAHVKRRERTRHLPIIFLTAAEDDLETALRGYSEGAVDYLTKPVNPYMLRSKVQVFVELDTKTRQLREQTLQLEQANVDLAVLAEEAQAASRAKSAFLNLVGHELRTPLTVFNGYAGLLRSGTFGDLGEAAARPLQVLEEKSEELRELVEMLLSAAQVESGQMPEDVQRLDLGEHAAAAVQRARARAALIGAELVYEAPGAAVRVDFDPSQLARVLDNLINNALAYGGDKPWVRLCIETGGHGTVLTVEDRGLGVPEELRERIFERFVRGNQDDTGPPGTGLGLYVCRELVERRGGRLVLADSAPGHGSRFQVHLPPAVDRRERSHEAGSNGTARRSEASRA